MRTERAHRIVVADDNRDAADTLAILLELSGFKVHVAYDGAQAVECAKAFDPAVVILDINMPVMDGYQAARLVRRSRPARGPLLIAVTARSAPDDLKAADAAGFDIHVVKPVTGNDLLRLIGDALSSVSVSR